MSGSATPELDLTIGVCRLSACPSVCHTQMLTQN